jgi:hypothetical protein
VAVTPLQYTATATAEEAVRAQGRMLAAAGGLVHCEGALYNTKGVVVAFGRITAQYSRCVLSFRIHPSFHDE